MVDETLTALRMRLGLPAAERWWEQVEGSRVLRWESIHAARAGKARALFFRFRDKDKSYSFTDCTRFVVMRELGLREALTTDRHFVQAGFVVRP